MPGCVRKAIIKVLSCPTLSQRGVDWCTDFTSQTGCLACAVEPPDRQDRAEDSQGGLWWASAVCGFGGCPSWALCGDLPQHHPVLPSPAGLLLPHHSMHSSA